MGRAARTPWGTMVALSVVSRIPLRCIGATLAHSFDIDLTDTCDHAYQSTIVRPGILENSLTLCVTRMA